MQTAHAIPQPAPLTIRCAECWNKPDLRCLHDEEIEAIEALGESYVCSECLEAAIDDDAFEAREHASHYVRNGSCI